MTIARITQLKILDGKNKPFESIYAHFIAQAKKQESETLHYSLCKSKTDPCGYLIYEEYTDEASMTAHGRTIHFNNEWTKLGLFIIGHPETVVMDVLSD